MGQSRRRKKKSQKTASTASVPPTSDSGKKVAINIYFGNIDFLEGSSKLDGSNGLNRGDSAPDGSIQYELEWSKKVKAIEWFKAGCDQDNSAEMWFSAALSKSERQELHSLFTSSGFPSLKTVSHGSEEERQIGILHISNVKWDLPTLSDADEKKARMLLGHLRDSGQDVSVDEVRGMIGQQALSAELEAIAARLVKDEQDVSALLHAITSGTAETVTALVAASPGTVNVKQFETGKLPLHTAAALGNISMMQLLVGAGASMEQEDGKGHTALKAARAAEECDAEGWLLQQGAQDHAAQYELTEAANITSLDSAAATVDKNGIKAEQIEKDGLASQAPANQEPQVEDNLPVGHDSVIPNHVNTPCDNGDTGSRDEDKLIDVGTGGEDVNGSEVVPEGAMESADEPTNEAATSVCQQLQSTNESATLAPVVAEPIDVVCRETGAALAGTEPDVPEDEGKAGPEAEVDPAATTQPAAPGEQAGTSDQTPAPKVNLVPEIEPAPPKAPNEDDIDDRLAMPDEQDEENGMDVLADWAGNAVAAVSEFCGRYPAVVATASAVLAVAGAVAVKLASSGRR